VLDAALPAIRDGGTLAMVRGYAGPSQRGIAIELVRVTSHLLNEALDWLGQIVAAKRVTLRVVETFSPDCAADAHRGHRGRSPPSPGLTPERVSCDG
jgi:NADPH2:quinone reductase